MRRLRYWLIRRLAGQDFGPCVIVRPDGELYMQRCVLPGHFGIRQHPAILERQLDAG